MFYVDKKNLLEIYSQLTVEIQISKFFGLLVVFGDLPRLPVVMLHTFTCMATKWLPSSTQ